MSNNCSRLARLLRRKMLYAVTNTKSIKYCIRISSLSILKGFPDPLMLTPAAPSILELSWHSVASSGVYLMRHRERRTCDESINFSPCHVMWVLGKCLKFFREEYVEELNNLLKDLKPFRGVQLGRQNSSC